MSPTFVRITLTGPDLDRCADNGYDQRIKLVLPLDGSGYAHMPTGDDWFGRWRALPDDRRNPLRTYTLRRVRPDRCEVDIDFALHGDGGPASRWAASAEPGQPCLILAPDADFTGEYGGVEFPARIPAATVVGGGDETAVPAICAILERLDGRAIGHALLEVPSAADIRDIDAPPEIVVSWLPRNGRPHGEPLVEAVSAVLGAPSCDSGPEDGDELWDTPDLAIGDGPYVWLAGEAGAMRTLRRHLTAVVGHPRSSMSVMGYWRAGHCETQA